MKKNTQDKTQQKGKQPFFARLLEAQELEQVAGAGGGSIETKKYPSDSDEAFTMKYPSDSDEGTCK